MKSILEKNDSDKVLQRLNDANEAFARFYPGESSERQPVHTIYGGAHLFKADTAAKMGKLALKNLAEYAPDFITLARALELPGAHNLPETISPELNQLAAKGGIPEADRPLWLAHTVYQRVVNKLEREPVEDFRIDFEDGFGVRPDREEDETAVQAAQEVAKGINDKTLPPFIGIRIKPFNREAARRGVRTLDVFLASLLEATGGKLPHNFVITLPKVQIPEQVSALVELFKAMENKTKLAPGSLKMEIMIETTQAVFDAHGAATIRQLVKAADGRCTGAHFGTYDYTASCGITSEYQTMDSPVCDFARHVMKVALAGTGIFLSDGATNIMPVGPNRSSGEHLAASLVKENAQTVYKAWKLQYDHIQHSLKHAYYQGWDLHPAQIPIRYAAIYGFFLSGLQEAALRLKNFMAKAAQATLSGDIFDDAATGQGLINYFLRALNCGAITQDEVKITGLSVEELQTRSFMKILAGRSALSK